MSLQGIKIIFEDNHLLIVNKPAGVLAQKDKTNDNSVIEILKDYIKEKYNKPGNVFLGSVHRLDRPASGLMVFAKTSKALTRLTTALRDEEFDKKYLAVVEKSRTNSEETLVHYLLKDEEKNIVKAFDKQVQGAKMAKLSYKYIGTVDGLSLLEVNLFTGRSHQIRSQLKASIAPICGDLKYGAKINTGNFIIYLHAYKLGLKHPVTKLYIEFEEMPPFEDPIWAKFKNFL
jgi:23S rRNA pseudouridine1911/1915/1917 synthase